MGVIARPHALFGEDALHFAHVFAEMLHRHGRVFHESQRLGVAAHGHEQTQPHFAHAPHAVLLFGGDGAHGHRRKTARFERGHFGDEFIIAVPVEFDNQHGGRMPLHPSEQSGVGRNFAREIDHHAVHQLDCGGV